MNTLAERTRHLGDGSGQERPLAAFLGAMASELAVQPEELMRRWSLGAVYASCISRWETLEQARADRERAKE